MAAKKDTKAATTRSASSVVSTAPEETHTSTLLNSQILAMTTELSAISGRDSTGLARDAAQLGQVFGASLIYQDAIAHLRRTQILQETSLALATAEIVAGNLDQANQIQDLIDKAVSEAQRAVDAASKELTHLSQ